MRRRPRTARAERARAPAQERDAWKQEASRSAKEARKLKDRLEEMAYKVNGLAMGSM